MNDDSVFRGDNVVECLPERDAGAYLLMLRPSHLR